MTAISIVAITYVIICVLTLSLLFRNRSKTRVDLMSLGPWWGWDYLWGQGIPHPLQLFCCFLFKTQFCFGVLCSFLQVGGPVWWPLSIFYKKAGLFDDPLTVFPLFCFRVQDINLVLHIHYGLIVILHQMCSFPTPRWLLRLQLPTPRENYNPYQYIKLKILQFVQAIHLQN